MRLLVAGLAAWVVQLVASLLESLIWPDGRSGIAMVPPVTLFLATGWWLLAAGTGMTYFPCR